MHNFDLKRAMDLLKRLRSSEGGDEALAERVVAAQGGTTANATAAATATTSAVDIAMGKQWKKEQASSFLHCCIADYGQHRSVNQLNNNHKIVKRVLLATP